MNKTEQNFWLDMALFVAFLITTLTAFLLWLVIPHTTGIVFLGSARSVWAAVHIYSGVAGLGGIVIHIAWHWDWLKAMRGRSPSGLPERLRANRIIDRVLWITFIATNVSGGVAWVLHFGDYIYFVSIADRLHVVFGVLWATLVVVHLALHWKWIASTTRRMIPVNLHGANSCEERGNI